MTNLVQKELTGIENLVSILLSTLDESIFFTELLRFTAKMIKSEKNELIRIYDDGRADIMIVNGRVLTHKRSISASEGILGQVVHTKRPYFSNNGSNDPLMAEAKKEGILAELVIPVVSEGMIIAALRFQNIKEERDFTREDVTSALSILSKLVSPINNMRMFLAAKALNEALLKQLESAHSEDHIESAPVTSTSNRFKIKETQMIGRSDLMREVVQVAERAAKAKVSAMVIGEQGTGRETIARRIHCRSDRKDMAFIAIDCSMGDQLLLEKELFGSEQLTAAGIQIKTGLLDLANGGTLVLKDINAITSATIQGRLLTLLKDGSFFRVNGQIPVKVDVRVISTSTKTHSELTLREDLLFLLANITLNVPALRQRKEDIEILANFFLNNGKEHGDQKTLAPSALETLKEYSWKGNIPELVSVIEQAKLMAVGMIIEVEHLARLVTKKEETAAKEVENSEQNIVNLLGDLTLEEIEKKYICMTLDNLGGNKTKTAKVLGITVKTLYNKLHTYGMVVGKELN